VAVGPQEGARIADEALAATVKLHERMRAHTGPTLVAAQALSDALRAGKKLLVFGNGGSAGGPAPPPGRSGGGGF